MQRVFSELAWRGSWQVKIYSQIMEGPDGACISQGTSGKRINDANLSSGTKAKRARTGARPGEDCAAMQTPSQRSIPMLHRGSHRQASPPHQRFLPKMAVTSPQLGRTASLPGQPNPTTEQSQPFKFKQRLVLRSVARGEQGLCLNASYGTLTGPATRSSIPDSDRAYHAS